MAHIRFANVDLDYPVRENQTVTLKEFIVRGLFRKQSTSPRTVPALRDLTFEVRDGERIGIIGLNGAGKSTLLRTIAGIFPIQGGTTDVQGSICSLFDITYGFEAEATGLQNIYLRCYLQGETPQTVHASLKDIEDFTELGKFLSIPVRYYSSGMLMKLGFAIATSKNPEILLIDEVFGMGDLVFKKKAEARMRDIIHRARIVVMVGHHLEFMQEFCTTVIWLHHGKVHAMGPTRQIIQAYSQEVAQLQKAA